MKKIAVFISGKGSNLDALCKACKTENINAKISLVISNNKEAKGIAIAQENNIPCFVIEHKLFSSRKEFEEEIHKRLSEHDCDYIFLAGFMRILSPFFINKWADKIVNIHPSLLPAFKGANAIEQALDYGVKVTGCTVHFVTEEVDSGSILKQAAVYIEENDTLESLSAKIHEKEHLIYKEVLKELSIA